MCHQAELARFAFRSLLISSINEDHVVNAPQKPKLKKFISVEPEEVKPNIKEPITFTANTPAGNSVQVFRWFTIKNLAPVPTPAPRMK